MSTDRFALVRRLSASCFLFLMVIFIVWAAISEYAAIASLQSRFAMSTWKASRGVTDRAEYKDALVKSHRALILNPYNADYFLDAANLYEWGAIRHPAWTPQAHERREQAIEYYRGAVNIRPSWGYAWAHLAHSKILDQQFDRETFKSFEKAMIMEPWAPEVQRKIIWGGIIMWDFLPPEQKELFTEAIKHILRTPHQSRFLLELVAYNGWEENLWPILDTIKHKQLTRIEQYNWPMLNVEKQKRYLKNAIKKYKKNRKN